MLNSQSGVLIVLPSFGVRSARSIEFEQEADWHLKRLGELANIEERDVSLSAFYATQVATRDTGLERELFLRPALELPHLCKPAPEEGARILRHRVLFVEKWKPMLGFRLLSGHAL